ncbi:MAG: hypothetical protein NT175_02025 [Bacteroidetes bacterium]|nr:hypothetical protein [Bacteroidota bacterium]
MENSIYYTFSTIAQVLAGILALLGAFAIFKIPLFRNRLSGLAQNFYDETDNLIKTRVSFPASKIGDLKKNMISRNYFQLLRSMEESLKVYKESPDVKEKDIQKFNNYYQEYKMLYISEKALMSKTRIVLIYTVTIILGSIFIIPFANVISRGIFILLLSLFFILLAINFYLILQLILQLIKD